MIDVESFNDLMDSLAEAFVPISHKKKDIYYDRLRDTDVDLLKKAVEILIDSYPYNRFPLVSEIKGAIDEISSKNFLLLSGREIFRCERCGGTGILLEKDVEGKVSASPCDCVKGQKRKRAWKNYFGSRIQK